MTEKNKQYDIFISYRRSDGFATARLIYDRLNQMGYNVSFDMETLRSGNFNTQLYERIENCRDVVVIVSPDALKLRDNPEHDWLRLEVAHALKHNKNIIPVFLRDVVVPQKEDLPADIAELVMKNGVTASEEHFDSALKKLCRMLHSRKKLKHKLFLSLGVCLVLAVAGGVYYYLQNPIYPLTASEKQEFSLIFNYLVQQTTNVNSTQHFYNRMLTAAQMAVMTGDMENFKDEKASFENHLKNQKAAKFQDSFVEMAARSKVIDAGDLKFYPQIYDEYMNFVTRCPDKLSSVLDPRSMISKNDQLKLIKINNECGHVLAESAGIAFISLFMKVKSPYLDDFKKLTVPQLTNLPVLSAVWPTKQTDIINMINSGAEKMEIMLQEESTILGNLKRDTNAQKEQLRDQWKKQGLTDEQIDKLMQKLTQISRTKTNLKEAQMRLKEIQQKARVKFAPQPNDPDGILWSKMIALKKSSLPDDALKALQVIRTNQSREISEPVCRVAEIVLTQPQDLPFVHGMVVCFFEAPATSHAIFKPGDVITQVNEKACTKHEDFRTAAGVKYVIYRLNKNGKFDKLTPVMPEKQPRTAVAGLPF